MYTTEWKHKADGPDLICKVSEKTLRKVSGNWDVKGEEELIGSADGKELSRQKEKHLQKSYSGNWESRNKPYIYGQLVFNKDFKWTVFSTHDAGTTGYPHTQEQNWTPTSHHAQKVTQSGS